jgi:hypothetical protein
MLLAVGVTAALFGIRVFGQMKEKRSFDKLFKVIELRALEEVLDETVQKALLYDLLSLRKQELSGLSTWRRASTFLLCWGFFGATLAYSLFHLRLAGG